MEGNLYILSFYPSDQFLGTFSGYVQIHFPHIQTQRVIRGAENLGLVLIQEGETIVINNNRAPLGWGHYARHHKAKGKNVYMLYPSTRAVRFTSCRGLDGVIYPLDNGEWMGFRVTDDYKTGQELPAQWVLQKSLGPSITGLIDITDFLEREKDGD